MTRKTYIVQAMDAAGAMLMDIRIDTRAAERLAMREGFQACGKNGGGWVRRQTEGAKGWAVYSFKPGDTFAHLLPPIEAQEIRARFDRWLASGGVAA